MNVLAAQERRILRDLSIIYMIYVSGWIGVHMASDWGSVPQWITAIVAVVALAVAAGSIWWQRQVARQRAALDFFIKTEMDAHLVDAYDKFWQGIDQMKTMTVSDFYSSKDKGIRKHYFSVRKYLNVHELVAVGIKRRILNHDICFDYWCDVLLRGVDAARPLIVHVRTQPGHKATYDELLVLYDKWKKLDSIVPTHRR
jgi:hypothetical protein